MRTLFHIIFEASLREKKKNMNSVLIFKKSSPKLIIHCDFNLEEGKIM